MSSSKRNSLNSLTSQKSVSSSCFKNLTSCFNTKNNSVDIDSNNKRDKNSPMHTNDDTKKELVAKENEPVHESPKKSEIAMKSAMLIQRWYRRYKSRIEIKKMTAWNIYQSIEYSGEQDHLKLFEFFLTLIKNSALITLNSEQSQIKQMNKNSFFSQSLDEVSESFNENSDTNSIGNEANNKIIQKVFKDNSSSSKDRGSFINPLKRKSKPEITVEPSYDGIAVKFPITKQNFHDLVNSFKMHKPLHAKYIVDIIEETIKELKKLKNINLISTSTKKQITLVGDLHGSLDDLLLIFYKNGFPSDDNPYLFNGDFVDRGPKSIEVSLIIFCGFLMSRSAVYINRGNHEDNVMNVRYGFLKEICSKYHSHSKQISVLYDTVFSWLPLASIIDSKIYVVHGGISDKTLIKDIWRIKRDKYISILKPPILDENGEMLDDIKESDLFEWKQMLDALWSDPKADPGVKANVLRGGGCCFGPDITEQMLKKNNLDLIIRSHECKQSGYEYTHGNKVLTIFSASNYYEYGSNNGAYAKITLKLKPIIIQFHVKEGNEVTKNLTLRERVNVIELSAIKQLIEKFVANKQKLMDEYRLKDTENIGAIALSDWIAISAKILELKLPWRSLRSKLVKLNQDGLVLYESVFEGVYIQSGIQQNYEENVTESLYRHKNVLESIFRAIDKDHSGHISHEEFFSTCELINKHDPMSKLSQSVMIDIANTMDIDKNGLIDLNEFLEAFRIVSTKSDF